MALTFGIQRTAEGGGRRASLTLPHGVVQTPVFMPVGTVASVKAVEQGVLERIGPDNRGAEIILANTYHLYLRPGHELVRRMGGVHRFMGWERPMLTVSGVQSERAAEGYAGGRGVSVASGWEQALLLSGALDGCADRAGRGYCDGLR